MRKKLVCIKEHPLLIVGNTYEGDEFITDGECIAYLIYQSDQTGHVGYKEFFIDFDQYERNRKIEQLGL
jgi:hypothetical protein